MNGITWRDILDIAVIGIVLYWVIMWLRGSRALQLLRGIAVLAILYLAASVFQLHILLWFFERFGAVLVIILILVFQPELRRALERVGQDSFVLERVLGKKRRAGEAVVASHIIRALQILSPKKVGALIVIEREISLNEFLESGTKMDSVVSSELIVSIFDSAGPLHDGAIIIQGERMGAAGCILPFGSEEFDKRFGTRHRAAAGISEHTDALAIVASEETGEIRVSEDGKLSGALTDDHLEEELMEFFGDYEKSARK